MVQLVERLLAKEKVTSSSLVARSENLADSPMLSAIFFRRRGQVGKAKVCKTLITGSNPVDASKQQGFFPCCCPFYGVGVVIERTQKLQQGNIPQIPGGMSCTRSQDSLSEAQSTPGLDRFERFSFALL